MFKGTFDRNFYIDSNSFECNNYNRINQINNCFVFIEGRKSFYVFKSKDGSETPYSRIICEKVCLTNLSSFFSNVSKNVKNLNNNTPNYKKNTNNEDKNNAEIESTNDEAQENFPDVIF